MAKISDIVRTMAEGSMALILFVTPLAACLAAICGRGPAFAIVAGALLLFASVGKPASRKAIFLAFLIALCAVPLG